MADVKTKEEFTPSGCATCAHAQVFADPDPDDWFCDDDVKVLCMAVKHSSITGEQKNVITCACRPYMVAKECSYIPSWCPQGGQVTPRSL